jgi:electron transport complex protein RnfG
MTIHKSKNPILFFLQESWLLLAAAAVFGTLLATLNYAWQMKIKQNESDKFNRLASQLLPSAASFETAVQSLPIDMGKGKVYDVDVKKALNAKGELVGWAFVCEGPGFADIIKLVVGVDATFDKMAGFDVLSSNETPGFGDKITIKDGFYQSQFKGVPVTELTLSKTGDPKKIDSEIIAISGATISSEAVVKILNAFLVPLKEKLKSDGLLQ